MQTIFKIPIYDEIDDFPAWHYDKKGVFSVKSAYGLARDYEAQELIRGVPACSTISNDDKCF